MSDSNPLEIRVQCGVCGAEIGEPCRKGDDAPDECADKNGTHEAFIPTRVLPEKVIEDRRKELLDTVIDSTAKELPSAPGTKPATDEELAEASVGQVLTDGKVEGAEKSPKDALG